jgi:hypothetical protein
MMNDQQKMGGVAALICGATFLVGVALAFTVLAPYATGELDPGQTVAFLVDNQTLVFVWNLIIYLVFGVFLIPLALALYQRLKANSPAMLQSATAFALIWGGLVFASGMIFNVGLGAVVDLHGSDPAKAASVWLAIQAVRDGLGGGNELVGGLWIVLISWAALRAGGLPRALSALGVVISLAGLLSIVPALGVLGAVFGLGSIVWFAWLGAVILRGRQIAAAV